MQRFNFSSNSAMLKRIRNTGGGHPTRPPKGKGN